VSIVMSEVYIALLAAGVPKDKAREAAEALYKQSSNALWTGSTTPTHAMQTDLIALKSDLQLLKLLGGVTLALVLAILWKLVAT
jgi:hypothetical protein